MPVMYPFVSFPIWRWGLFFFLFVFHRELGKVTQGADVGCASCISPD